ncbi:hypothetical protein P5673_032885 [Acropora cervicornis]|uniref:Uncharacterized protein n=1 Tax=Acropora cervicornis TaxID=6130 RepID=A0AAD9URL9_ACRCE|nr:hypothetical protein P5673_032885 [Acropora cervicornis]
MERRDTNYHRAISLRERVAITLYTLADTVMKEEFDEEWLEGVQLHLNIQPRDREEKQDREAADIRNALKSFLSYTRNTYPECVSNIFIASR